MMSNRSAWRLLAGLLAAGLLLSSAARADDDEHEHHGRRRQSAAAAALLPAYAQECGACHLAFAPRFLPAGSWQHLMNGLGRHYGSDASLDPAAAQQIGTWLQQNAAQPGSRAGAEQPPEDRISRSRWFIRKHDEVSASVWKRASVKSAANCAACHTGAAQGDYSEHAVRIPR
jgi:hypothetical protein